MTRLELASFWLYAAACDFADVKNTSTDVWDNIRQAAIEYADAVRAERGEVKP